MQKIDHPIQHILSQIPPYEMNTIAQSLIQEKTEEWGLSPEQSSTLCSAAPEELDLLGQTIRKVWKWHQFTGQTEYLEELVGRKELLKRGLARLDAEDPAYTEKQMELTGVTQDLQQALTVERDQEDAVAMIVSEVQKWTRTGAKKNALHKLLNSSPTYRAHKHSTQLSEEDYQTILSEVQTQARQQNIFIADNGQTFESTELYAMIATK